MLYLNLKNGRVYKYISSALNATNKNNGLSMVIYKDIITDVIYVREETEFFAKFDVFEP